MKESLKKALKQWRWIFLVVLFFITTFVWYVIYREDRHGILTVAFLDVGQGDAIYIEAPNGNQILLDGGPDGKVIQALDKVMPFYDRSIDILALSHPHLDHFGGFLDILPRYFVGAVLSSGTLGDTQEYKTFNKIGLPGQGGSYLAGRQATSGIKQIIARIGMVIDMGRGVTISVLLPTHDVTNVKPHDGVMVLRLNYGKTSILLTGDMEKNLEDYLITLEGERLQSDVLKVGHHGSKTSSSEELLGFVSPEYAIISVGAKNMYGHPAEEVLGRLASFEIKTLRTDQNGTIILKSDGETLRLK
ncbi:MBL fold metallo-hydrolase [Candidatus Gottesmanbacteria bacterium]|nr:MBL fold metallo-hydrolase [Candidatus Gottesmanbacteria bacterium]